MSAEICKYTNIDLVFNIIVTRLIHFSFYNNSYVYMSLFVSFCFVYFSFYLWKVLKLARKSFYGQLEQSVTS